MAAYASLCSLMYIIDQLQNHPHPPILIDKTQVESLTQKATFLQEFLEGYSHVGGYSNGADPLESRIVDAARAAEDVIESHIVDQIHARHDHKIRFLNFVESFWDSREAGKRAAQLYQSLREVMEDMDSIKKEIYVHKKGVRDQHRRNSMPPANSFRLSIMRQKTMVGFDDAMVEILDKLTGGDRGRQVIPIVGMGGMGKTTLARNVYVNPLIQEHFDICAWATISQEYNMREILRVILCPGKKEDLRDVEELGEKLYKHLSGRRYLIVLDDLWSIEAWDEVRRFFPDFNDGSRIVITTRLSNMTSELTDSYKLKMKFLDNDKSWNLLCKTVFGEERCPPELEVIGKNIVEICRGLPLSIVVTGGLLMKSKLSLEYWEYIAEHLNPVVNSEHNERCLNILYLSYKQLPVYLKPCFLYMGVFKEDSVIRPKELIRLWVAEGFLKPTSGRSLEEVGEEFLEELIDRNLVRAWRRVGNLKDCKIHDLLRDLCLREAQKESFYSVMKVHDLNDSKGINTQRRIVIPKRELDKEVIDELQSMPLVRSLIWEGGVLPPSLNCRLLRVLHTYKKYKVYSKHTSSQENKFGLVNSRYFAIHDKLSTEFPSSVCLLWNLQTLTVGFRWSVTAPSDIWMMPQLRHVKFVNGLYLPDPPKKDDAIVITNLQSLSTIVNFKCSEEVINRIPNLKKLRTYYYGTEGSSHYFVNNLERLHKLESFDCASYLLRKTNETEFLHKLSFPHSLKKLTLKVNYVYLDEMMEKIGSLPLLEVLKLTGGSFKGCVWETVEGQFSSLKSLSISHWIHLQCWNSESAHFPCLQQLFLDNLHELKEIPSDIGEIATLQSIHLRNCSYSAVTSATKILEEQEELGNVTLQVRVFHLNKEEKEALESLESSKSQVQHYLKKTNTV